jgi:hypothetical protein
MRTTLNRIPRVMTAVAGSLTAAVLLLSVQGCGTTADATTAAAGPNPADALKVFNSYVTANKVAVANRDQLLAESLTSSAQFDVLSSQYQIAADTGVPVASPSYGKPTLYVPRLTTYPQWFMATAPEYPAHGRPETAMMVFDRPEASGGWTVDGIVQLAGNAPALNVAVNKKGYATALATTDGSLEFRPDEVGATHASVVDEGPSSAAATVVAAGPQTTGIYQANAAYAGKIRAGHWIYTWQMEGTSYPFFALGTTDGGAIVFYTMSLNRQTVPAAKPPAHPKVQPPSIPVPDVYKSLIESGQKPFTNEFDADSTLQFLAVDPPGAKNGSPPGKLRIVGNGGSLTYAGGS